MCMFFELILLNVLIPEDLRQNEGMSFSKGRATYIMNICVCVSIYVKILKYREHLKVILEIRYLLYFF